MVCVLTQINFESILFFWGVVLFFLASMVRIRSLPLNSGIILFAADAMMEPMPFYQAGNSLRCPTLVSDVFLIYYLYQGVKAIQKEKNQEF